MIMHACGIASSHPVKAPQVRTCLPASIHHAMGHIEATKYGVAAALEDSGLQANKPSEQKHIDRVLEIGDDCQDVAIPRVNAGSIQILLCAVCFIDGADMQLLPASFRALEVDLGLSPVGLGQMSFAQSLFQSVTAPFWGVLADRYSRKGLLVFSCTAWGVLTALLACASSISTIFALRCAHGATLASLSPIGQSIVADIVPQDRRGAVFGRLGSATSLGQTLSSLVGTWIASETLAFGVRGWRATFMFVATLSIISGLLLYLFMSDPRRERSMDTHVAVAKSACCAELKRALQLFRIPTFVVIVLQGVFGNVPWNALGFVPMFVQYSGHSAASAALVMASILVGGCFGSILGGSVADSLAQRCPAHGRPFTAQISVSIGIPLIAFLVWSAPRAAVYVLMMVAFLFGLTASWCGVGVNRPILTEIVDPAYRATVIAWLTVIEGSSAALFGAPVVGYLAEKVFHYEEVRDVELAEEAMRRSNAEALGSALLWGALPPWGLCFCFFTLLHCTYARDAARANSYAEFADDGMETLDFPDSAPPKDSQNTEAIKKVGYKVGQKVSHKVARSYDALHEAAAPNSATEHGMHAQGKDDASGDAI